MAIKSFEEKYQEELKKNKEDTQGYSTAFGISSVIFPGAGMAGLSTQEAINMKKAADAAKDYVASAPQKIGDAYDSIYGNMTLHVTNSNGEKENINAGDLKAAFIKSTLQNTPTVYYNDDGKFDTKPSVKISLDEKTGDIKISGPKSIIDSEDFKRTFDTDYLKSYSQAYKLNKDYKVTVQKGSETTNMTIPEYIKQLNGAAENYSSNLETAEKIKGEYAKTYGNKAYNLNLSQVAMSQGSDKAIYIPKSILGASSFGDNTSVGNPFKNLKVDENGMVSLDELKKAYNRNYLGRSEMAGILAILDGSLRGSDWSKDTYYKTDDGEEVYNASSAEEAAKILAFRNFVLSNDPDAEWWQTVGDNIESAAMNALAGFDRVFLNIANLGEMVVDFAVPGEQIKAIGNTIKDMDEALGNWNEEGTLVHDSTQVLATLGYIGGTIAGTVAASKLGGYIFSDAQAILGKIGGKAGISTRFAALATQLGETDVAAKIISQQNNVSTGARFVIGLMDNPRKAAMLTSMALDKTRQVVNANVITQFLFDTLHDAVLYDSVTLRETLQSTDQDTKDYWLSQLSDNAKWWIGMGAGKTLVKFAGKTTLGKAVDATVTPLINKVAAKIGTKKQAIKDYVAGGSVTRKLEKQLEKALDNNELRKANRIKRKISQEEWNEMVRDARKALGDIKLDWDGVKLTEKSLEEYNNLRTRVKALENSIDSYNRNIEYKRQEMIGAVKDPSTGKMGYINPTLAGSNIKATDFYMELTDLAKKYNLPAADGSLLSQDMVDYMMGRYYEGLATSFASGATENAAKAQNALGIISGDLNRLRETLPSEIIDKIDEGLSNKIYQSWYYSQNEYGMAKGLLNREKITSYQNNQIWQDNGYMPIVVQHDRLGHWVEDSGGIEAVIEQDFNTLTFDVGAGQHYVDPEMVRQSRLSNLARAEVNSEIFKAYSGFGSNATNLVKISGEETQYMNNINDSKKYFEAAIDKSARNFSEDLGVDIAKIKAKKPTKNKTVPINQRSSIIAVLSPDDTKQILTGKKVLTPESPKLTSNVNNTNYGEWYLSQSNPVKKYLTQEYSKLGVVDSADYFTGRATSVNQFGENVRTSTAVNNGFKKFVDSSVSGNMPSADILNAGVKKYHTKTGDVSERINNKLRQGKKLAPSETKITNALDESFTQNLKQDTILYRGEPSGVAPNEKTFTDNGYMYLTADPEVAMRYAGKNGVVYKMHFGSGQKIIVPSDQFDEAIVIAPRGMTGDVLDVYKGTKPANFKRAKKLIEVDFSKKGANLLAKAEAMGGDDFEAGLERAYLLGDKEFARSSLMNQAARNVENGKDAFYGGVVDTAVKGKLHNIKNIDTDLLVDDLDKMIRKGVDNYVRTVLDDEGAKFAMATLSEVSNGSDAVGRYLAIRQLESKGMDDVYKRLDDIIDKAVAKKSISFDDVNNIKKQSHALAKDIIGNELNSASNAARTINPDLVDSKDIYQKAKDINDRIMGAKENIKSGGDDNSNYVMYLDQEGRQVFAEVDPAFASLFNYRHKMSKVEASVLAKTNAAMSKLFRYGTTSVNLTSFGNQMFRDFGNAVLVGGSWQTIKSNADNLTDVFGANIVNQIKKFDPSGYEMKQLKALSKASGQSLEEAAVSRELMRGAAISPTTTERTLYKTFMKEAYGDSNEGMLMGMKNKFQEFIDKYNPDELLNGKRENYLRNRVYASSLNDAMKSGYTLEQSRVFAEFAMNNATTNFARQLYHMQAIADSTPYFRAAINGTKSFWRMWSLDPVGISGRVMGGLILPVMMLTGASLGDKKNREVYMNIPEYQKQDSLVFVINGQIVSAPIPQELSAIVAPFRQFTEYLYDANKNDFWELMMNDLLGFSPVDLQGFSTIDMDQMIADPTIFDRISRGSARVFSQMAPIPVKSAYMLATGTDPYSGKSLRDKSYAYWNDETGSVEIMDYNQSSFAKWFASLFGDWMSSDLAEKVVSGIIGNTGIDILDTLTTALQEGPEAWLASVGTHTINRISAPYTIPNYNQVDAIWKRAVRQLTSEKEAILDTKEMKTLNSQLSQEKDPEKRKELLSQRQDLVDEYQQKVGDMVKRLNSEYQGNFDRKKFAAVIQLLNFNTDATYQSGSQYSSDIASDTFWDGRNLAVRTMVDMGVDGTSDVSVFGYATVDKDGNPVIKYSSPTAIMDMKTQWNVQDDIHLANIETAIKSNNLWDEHQAVKDQVDAIYSSKKKLSDSDYDKIDAIYVNWNAHVMSTIAQYIQEMTPEAAINNSNVIDYLDSLIEIPGDYKVDKRGYHVTNNTLGKGSAKDAYIKNYIREIFKVNNTGYAGGKNFSGRK